jgi:hypothetical protein
MSEIKIISMPIPIRYSKSYHSYSNPNNEIQKYLFELIITLNKFEKKTFRNLENSKHSNLININDQIMFSNIDSFRIIVSKLPSEDSIIYQLDGKINQLHSVHSQKDDNIYIEFSQNSNGYVMCNCSFVGFEFSKYCISPPN